MTDGRRYVEPATILPLLREVSPGHHSRGRGIHGITHWARVLENGLRLAESTGANRTVVTLFAAFHDARRVNDHIDPGHGRRGAALAREMRARWLDLTNEEMDLLDYACAYHTDGLTEADTTVQTCWDADRLDLPRVLITIKPNRLCTAAAKTPALIAWAAERAKKDYVPGFAAEWIGP